MFYRVELTYDEIIDTLEANYIAASSTGHTLPTGIDEIIDIVLMLKSLVPDEVKINITIGDIRLKSN